MPVDSAGNVSRPPSPLPVTGQNADAPQVNVPLDDIYAILNLLVFLDGRKPWRGSQDANGYRITGAANGTDPQDYVTKAQLDAAIAAVSGFFPGFMQVDTATSSAAPAGWLYANGQTVSRTTFAALWARVSTGNNLAASEGAKTVGQYGPGDGSTTFTLPNLYADGGYFIRPISSGRGIGTVQADEIKSHSHAGTAQSSGSAHAHQTVLPSRGGGIPGTGGAAWSADNEPFGVYAAPTQTDGAHTHPLAIDSTGGTETRPRNIAYPVLIKT